MDAEETPTINRVVLAFLRLFGLRGTRFHLLHALHDLSEPVGDVLEMVHLSFLGFAISFRLPVAEAQADTIKTRNHRLHLTRTFIYISHK